MQNVFASLEDTGYRSFENFAGTFGWSPEEYRKIYKSYGLRAVADHGAMDPATFDQRLDQAAAMKLKYVGSGPT